VATPFRWAVAATVALLAGACQVDVHVGVEVDVDGSGTVRVDVALDEEAARRVPRLADQLALDDLRSTGWWVRGPGVEGDGRTWIRLSKPFASPSAAGEVLDELTGPEGAFGGLTLERDRSVVGESWRFRGQVDLRDRLDAFSDPALRDRLGGTSVGRTEAELERLAGRPLEEALRFELTVALPGSLTSDGDVRDGRAVWEPTLGRLEAIDAVGHVRDTPRVALLAVAGTATAVLVLLLVRTAVVGRAGARAARLPRG